MAEGRLPIAGAGRAEQPQHVLASLLSDAVESVEHEHVANGGPDLRVIDPVGLDPEVNVSPTGDLVEERHQVRHVVLDAAMAQPPQPPPGPEHTDVAHQPPPVPTSPSDLDQARRTSMAAERTWLAWWRTALAATAGALAVGRFAPELLDVAAWPYVVLGCGYASLAVGLWLVGAQRQRELEHALRTGGHVPLRFRTVGLFTVGGVALAVMTVVLVIAQT